MVQILTYMKFVHVLSVTIWISALPAAIFIRKIAADFKDKERDILNYIITIGKMAFISSILILITGGAMTGSNWFQFDGNYIWLAIKQLLFFVLIGIFILITRMHKKLKKLLLDEAVDIKEIRSFDKKLIKFEHISMLLVIINLFLAVTKPF